MSYQAILFHYLLAKLPASTRLAKIYIHFSHYYNDIIVNYIDIKYF